MAADQLDAFAPILASANRQLSRALKQQTRLGDVVRLSDDHRRNLLLRCRDLAGDSSSSFIIKKVVADSYNPRETASWDTNRFFSDWAGAEFLSGVLSPHRTPRFFGGDHELGFFILEDLGEHRSLVEPLLEEDAASADRALISFSTCLGAVHAGTIGHSAAFARILHDRSPQAGIFGQALTGFRDRLDQLQPCLDGLGVRHGKGDARETEAVITAIERPGPFLSYVHGDACPDNVFWNGEVLRLIDFEFGGFGHALADAAYGRMLFPSCWCANRIPSDLVSRMETAYRAELVKGCPQAGEDRIFQQALVTVCAFWLLSTLGRHLAATIDADGTWGIATMRQRVLARLEAFIMTAEEFDQLPALRGMASRLQKTLIGAWADTLPLPLYPSFNALSTTSEGKRP